MPTFKDQSGYVLIPANTEAIFTVTEFDAIIRESGKTKGATQYNVKLEIHDDQGHKLGSVKEQLIDHPSVDFKIDGFLRASNAVAQYGLKVGQAFEFIQTRAASKRVAWVDPIGLRGWCVIGVKDVTSQKDGSVKQFNEVAKWIDNKGAVERIVNEFAD